MKAGLDIQSVDKRNSTPLHWAAFAGSELALAFIVACDIVVDSQDNKGLTPLHLAVKASEDSMTTRNIRALILKGANTMTKTFEGRLPVNFLEDFDTEAPNINEL